MTHAEAHSGVGEGVIDDLDAVEASLSAARVRRDGACSPSARIH